jgi:hypothetical protein
MKTCYLEIGVRVLARYGLAIPDMNTSRPDPGKGSENSDVNFFVWRKDFLHVSEAASYYYRVYLKLKPPQKTTSKRCTNRTCWSMKDASPELDHQFIIEGDDAILGYENLTLCEIIFQQWWFSAESRMGSVLEAATYVCQQCFIVITDGHGTGIRNFACRCWGSVSPCRIIGSLWAYK